VKAFANWLRKTAPVFSEVNVRSAALFRRQPHVAVPVCPLLRATSGDSIAGGLPPRDRNLVRVAVANVAATISSAGFFNSPKGALLVQIHLEKSEKRLLDERVEGACDVVVVDVLRVGNAAATIIYQTREWRQVQRLQIG
jgi:hypothetical protein